MINNTTSEYTEYDKPNLKPFDTFTIFSPFGGLNGYVVIPDDFTNDYFDDFYDQIDAGPVGGLTFGGWVSQVDGSYRLVFHGETNEEMTKANGKSVTLKCIGFDDAHFYPNEMDTVTGAKYIAEQLKQLVEVE